jgi:glutamine synthetase adenylyltransferase
MKKSELKKIIKEEIARVLQEETQEKLQGSFNTKDFTSAGLATNSAQKASQAINKLKGAKGTLDDVKLEKDEKEAFSKLFVTLLKVDDSSLLNKLISNIKSFMVKKTDKPTS